MRQIRLSDVVMIGSVLELEEDRSAWTVVAVRPDTEGLYQYGYGYDDLPTARPSTWIVDVRPATPSEIEQERLPAWPDPPEPRPWWRRLFG